MVSQKTLYREADFFFFLRLTQMLFTILLVISNFTYLQLFSRISNYESVTFLTKVIACFVSFIKFPCFFKYKITHHQF